jgi:hypothetical protein
MSPKQNMLMVWLLLAGPDLPVKALAKTMGVLAFSKITLYNDLTLGSIFRTLTFENFCFFYLFRTLTFENFW